VTSHDSDDPESPFIDVEALSDDDDDNEEGSAAKPEPTPSTSYATVERGMPSTHS
jgi:hypothetical protein